MTCCLLQVTGERGEADRKASETGQEEEEEEVVVWLSAWLGWTSVSQMAPTVLTQSNIMLTRQL